MEKLDLCVPCLFGLEGPVGNELRHMGLTNVMPENGHVRFTGDESAVARVNLRSRFGERVLIELGRFEAKTFDQLFEGVKALPLADVIPRDGQFPVKGYCLNSALHSVPDCQRIIKKAASVRLGADHGIQWLPETGALYQLQFSIIKDRAEIYLDTTGAPLFKRGYRPGHVAAPLRETLAAAMVNFARYRGREAFWDPFCGSGTIPIEAALIAKNRAPGLYRSFAAEGWATVDPALWRSARTEALDREYSGNYQIFASDIDPKSLDIARSNAKKARVEGLIRFSQQDAAALTPPAEAGILVCNPPYGERMLEKREARELYRRMGESWNGKGGWKQYYISSDEAFEQFLGRRADKKRKLYNGMIRCNYYMYL